MIYKYNPQKFWGSINRIKEIKSKLLGFPPSLRRKIKLLLYMAMEATRRACIATIEENDEESNSYRRDMETDRKFLEEVVSSFR